MPDRLTPTISEALCQAIIDAGLKRPRIHRSGDDFGHREPRLAGFFAVPLHVRPIAGQRCRGSATVTTSGLQSRCPPAIDRWTAIRGSPALAAEGGVYRVLGQASAAGTAITVSTNGARCQPSLASANAAAPKAIATITRRQSSAVKMNIADTQRAGTGAQEIGAIDSTNPCRGCGKSETNSVPGCRERHRQQQVHRRQV